MNIVKMETAYIDDIKRMSRCFYSSDAVLHEVPNEYIENNISEALSENKYFKGYVFIEDGAAVGFSYISEYYETEVGGMCAMIIDLYIDEQYRGKGFGTQFFEFVFREYKHAKRFRLEVEENNASALKLYKGLGFKQLSYMQMIIEK